MLIPITKPLHSRVPASKLLQREPMGRVEMMVRKKGDPKEWDLSGRLVELQQREETKNTITKSRSGRNHLCLVL